MSSEADEAQFLAAIERDPDDEAGRQVYADLLEDRGEAARAEYLRAEAAWCRLTRRFAQLKAGVDAEWLKILARPRAVLLVAVGDRKIEIIREVRRATGLGLAPAKAIVEAVGAGTPRVIVEDVDQERASLVAGYFSGLAEARIIVGSPRRSDSGR